VNGGAGVPASNVGSLGLTDSPSARVTGRRLIGGAVILVLSLAALGLLPTSAIAAPATMIQSFTSTSTALNEGDSITVTATLDGSVTTGESSTTLTLTLDSTDSSGNATTTTLKSWTGTLHGGFPFTFTPGLGYLGYGTVRATLTSSTGTTLSTASIAIYQRQFVVTDAQADNYTGIPQVYRPSNWSDCTWGSVNNWPSSCPVIHLSFNQQLPSNPTGSIYVYQVAVFDQNQKLVGHPTSVGMACRSGSSCDWVIEMDQADLSASYTVVVFRALPGYTGSPSGVDDLTVDPGHLDILDQSTTFVLSRLPYQMQSVQTSPGNVQFLVNQPVESGLGLYIYDNAGHLARTLPVTIADGQSKMVVNNVTWFGTTDSFSANDCAILRNVSTKKMLGEECPAAGIHNSELLHSTDEDYAAAGDDPSGGPITCAGGDPVLVPHGLLVRQQE
jgi:hypothetical protein